MKRTAPVRTFLLPALAALWAVGAQAENNWVSDIEAASISSRSSYLAMIERAEERAATGYYCVDIEIHDGTVYGIFVKSPAITDGKIELVSYPFMLSPSMEEEGWRQIDFELHGYSTPGEVFYLAVYIKTEGITGDGYFSRGEFDDLIERKREVEDNDGYIIDLERVDGQWWAIIAKSTHLFAGHATISSRGSFAELKDRMEELEDSGNRTIDIECVGDQWYGVSVHSDTIGNTGMYSRGNFADFAERHQELKAEGRYLIDMEIDRHGFYGLVVSSTVD